MTEAGWLQRQKDKRDSAKDALDALRAAQDAMDAFAENRHDHWEIEFQPVFEQVAKSIKQLETYLSNRDEIDRMVLEQLRMSYDNSVRTTYE